MLFTFKIQQMHIGQGFQAIEVFHVEYVYIILPMDFMNITVLTDTEYRSDVTCPQERKQ